VAPGGELVIRGGGAAATGGATAPEVVDAEVVEA
jgi:hypothetical protein